MKQGGWGVGGCRRECAEAVDAHIVETQPLRAMARRVEDSKRGHAIVHAQLLHRRERHLVPIVSLRHVARPSSARPQLELCAIKLMAAQERVRRVSEGVCGGKREEVAGAQRWRGGDWTAGWLSVLGSGAHLQDGVRG